MKFHTPHRRHFMSMFAGLGANLFIVVAKANAADETGKATELTGGDYPIVNGWVLAPDDLSGA